MKSLQFVYPVGIAVLLLISSLFAPDYINPLIPVIIAVTSGFLFVYIWHSRDKQNSLPVSVLIPVVLLVSVFLISTVFSVDIQTSIEKSLKFISGILLFAATYYWLKTDIDLNRKILLNLLFVSACLVIAAGFGMFLAHTQGDLQVYSAIFGQRDVAAGFLILFIPLFMTLGLSERNKPLSVLYIIAGIMILSALILTGSRGGWIAGGIVIALWVVLNIKNIIKKPVPIILFIVIPLLLAALVNMKQISQTAATIGSVVAIKDSSLMYRIGLYEQAIQVFRQFPLTGSGPGTFGQMSTSYGSNVRYFAEFAHSLYFQMLAETGILGFIGIIALFGAIFWHGIRAAINKQDNDNRAVIIALLLGLTGFMLHVITDLDWEYQLVQIYFWMIAALLLSFIPTKNISSGFPYKGTLIYAAGAIYILISLWVLADIIMFYQGDKMIKAKSVSVTGEAALKQERELNPMELAGHFFRNAVLIDPFDWRSRQSLSIVYLQQNDNANALAEAQNLVRLTPYNTLSWSHLAKLAKKTGNYDISEQAYKKAIALAPYQTPINYIGLGKLYEQAGKPAKTKEIYNTAMGYFAPADVISKDAYNPEYRNHVLYIYQHAYLYESDQKIKESIQDKIALLMKHGEPEYTTPETLLKTFWAGMNSRELEKVRNCFVFDIKDTQQALIQLPIEVKSAQIQNLHLKRQDEFNVVTTYNIEYTSQTGQKVLSPLMADTIVLQAEGWKIKELGILKQQ